MTREQMIDEAVKTVAGPCYETNAKDACEFWLTIPRTVEKDYAPAIRAEFERLALREIQSQ
jgi:hypothetical protein